MLIGYMHYRKNPSALNKAYAFAAVARAEGVDLLYFSPCAVDFNHKTINGYAYRDGGWAGITSRFPDVVCNVAAFSGRQAAAAERLGRQVPFTSFSIGDKLDVYDNLTGSKTFAGYLIPTQKAVSAAHLLALAGQYTRTVFKPVAGCQGTDVCFITKTAGAYTLQTGADQTALDAAGLAEFAAARLTQRGYIVQPYINCRTRDGRPYDLRLHVMKGAGGRWAAPFIYPRISADGGAACNLSRGGHTTGLADFLKSQFGGDGYDVQKYLETFALQLARHMDDIQRRKYGETLDELGIDAGFDEQRRLYLYEINWRPGHPPCMYVDLTVVRSKVRYAMYVAGGGRSTQ